MINISTPEKPGWVEPPLWWVPVRPRRPGLYWKGPFQIDRSRLNTSYEILHSLRPDHPAERGSKRYPWRLGLFPATGLPAFLRIWRPQPLPDGDEQAREVAFSFLAQGVYADAIFGRDSVGPGELTPGPTIKLAGRKRGGEDQADRTRHFTWRQLYNGYPVLGGGVRLHEVMGDERVSVTSSYFPVADAPPSFGQEIEPELLDWRALQAVARTVSAGERSPFLIALARRFLARWRPGDLIPFLWLLMNLYKEGQPAASLQEASRPRGLWAAAGRWLERMPAVERAVVGLGRQLWRLLRLDRRAADVNPVPICGKERAILPFDGAYHLICRVRVQASEDDPWYADLDVESGEVLGEPWQAVAHAANFYASSSEARPGGHPTGTTADLIHDNIAGLASYVGGLPLNNLAGATIEETTVAAHAWRLLQYLRDICGVDAAQLQGYVDAAGNSHSPGLRVEVGSNQRTGFRYDESDHPKPIRFQHDPGPGIEEGTQRVYAPARDPEVILHEFAHGFLWLLDPEPWDTPPTLGPFGRALHEGYAFYLARSLAAQVLGEAGQLWACAAYSDKKPDSSPNWGNRWAFDRPDQEVGADLLPAANCYPAGSYSPQDILVYDVAMVWARALWDLRKLLGPEDLDWLLVQAYPYLHGYIANFELAAEALIDVDIRRRAGINLANGTLPLWATRGIAAGQGVHGFAQAANGDLIAASDAGILSLAAGGHWTLETDNLAGGGTLTGVVAVAADGNTFYAAAQLPPAAADVNAQWRPGVFRKTPGAGPPIWEPVGNWAAEAGNATPLCLLVAESGADGQPPLLLAGTGRGVYRWPEPRTSLAGEPGTGRWQLYGSNNDFSALDLTMVTSPASGNTFVRACAPGELHQLRWAPVPQSLDWTPASASAFGGDRTVRLMAITTWDNQVFVGALNGLWKVAMNWDTVLAGISASVLALSGRDTAPYFFATPDGVYRMNSVTALPQLLPGLPADAKVISLHATAAGVLAGTLAHGIWQHNGAGWQQVYAPPPPPPLRLAPNERALVSLMQSGSPAGRIRVTRAAGVSANVTIEAVARPGFPLRIVEPDDSGLYNLAAGPVILLLRNGGNPARVQVGFADGAINVEIQDGG